MAEITECPNCKVRLVVTEYSGGFPGGKEREFGYCPECGTVVAEEITSGLISVRLADEQS